MIPALQVPYYPICSIYVQLSGILRNRKVTLCLSKALKQTCYCLLHMLSVKTLEVTLGDSYHCLFFSIEQSAIMENVVVQIPKMLTKQFNREMLSLKKNNCAAKWSFPFSTSFVPTSHSKVACQELSSLACTFRIGSPSLFYHLILIIVVFVMMN